MKRPRAPRRRDAAPASPSRRVALMFGLQTATAAALAWRMRRLQLEEGDLYRTLAEENRVNIRLLPPARGEIFDRRGLPVAVNRQNYRVTVTREQIKDPAETLDMLRRLTPIGPAEYEKALRELETKPAFVPVTIAEHLDWERFSLIAANLPSLPGVSPEVGLTRWYPEGNTLAHVTGHVGRVSERDLVEEGDDDPLLRIPDFQIGKNGVERVLEPELRGAAGTQRIEVNAVGRVIRELDRAEPTSGEDLTLTIDLDLQRHAMERMGSESAACCVVDTHTGDVTCLASAPGFDPNQFVVGIGHEAWNALLDNDHRPLANKTVSGQYPPGSTFKMIVAMAALEKGVVGPSEEVFCNGGYRLGNRTFHCWRRGGHGMMDVVDALEQSCDVYFYEIAKRVGVDAISEMANRLGLGVRMDLPMTAIRSGLTPTRAWKRETHDESWQVGDSLNVGIGQGFVLATPLQLAVMTARIASGRAVEPRLVMARRGVNEPAAEAPPLDLSRQTLSLIREGMNRVMNGRSGTARKSRIHDEANLMAGKTGTSQVRRITMAERARGVTRNEDLPWNRRDHALFVGYAPLHAPRYACSVVVEHGGGGSSAAAPIARDVMMRALYGPEPPLEAYPPAERDGIRQEREKRDAPATRNDPTERRRA